jgi:dTDP-4-amino-4,6-dideoxygalactose transaminase
LQLNQVDRNILRQQLAERGIPAMVYYPIPLHKQKAFASDRFKEEDFKITEKLCDTVLSLPIHTELDETTLEYITTTFLELI